MRRITVRLGDYVEEEKRRDRRGGRAVAIVALVAIGALAMWTPQAAPPPPGTPARLASLPAAIPFAPQLAGTSSAAQLLRLRNDGGEALSVAKLTVNGDAFRLSHDCNAALAPNESCSAAIVFTPGAPGPQSGTFSVESNGGTATIALEGEGRSLPAVDLGGTDFGRAAVGTAVERIVRFINSSTAPIAVAKSSVAEPFAIAADGCSGTVVPGGNCDVHVQFRPAGEGSATGELLLAAANGAVIAKGVLLGAGAGAEQPPQPLKPAHLVTSPPSLVFAPQLPGTASGAQFIQLSNDGEEALTIANIDVRGPFRISNDCAKTLARNESCRASVVFAPQAAGKQRGVVAIYSSGGSATIALNAEGSALPVVVLKPADFGRVFTGATADRAVTFTNSAPVTVVVGKATAPPPFAIVADGCGNRKIGPGDSCEVRLQFRPAARGSMKGELQLVSASGETLATGELRGLGLTKAPPQLPSIDIKPREINFHGDPGKKTIVVTNTGPIPVDLSAKPETTSRYLIDATQCNGTLAPGKQCTITVDGTFAVRIGSSVRVAISYLGRTELVPVAAK